MTNVDERRRTLMQLLRDGGAASQDELVEKLAQAGHPITQATVSRDLDAIGAVKGRKDGSTAYLLPDQLGGLDAQVEEMDRILGEWLVGAEAAGSLVVLRSRPGSAHILGAALDAAALPEIAGTIAGDDTLFIALRDGHDPAALAAKFTGTDQ